MNQKSEYTESTIERPKSSYYQSLYKDFRRTTNSKFTKSLKNAFETPKRPSSNYYSTKSTSKVAVNSRRNFSRFKHSFIIQEKGNKTRNKNGITLRPFTAKIHSRESLPSREKQKVIL